MDSPFPWFGGKRKVAAEVWARFGDVDNYVEPFFGSGAVLFGRPDPTGNETINDLDGYVANFWRSVKLSPEATAEHADNPVNENDLHARHIWLVHQRDTLRPQLDGDEPLVVVALINSTPEAGEADGLVHMPDGSWRKRYLIRVPPDMTTARQAVAWTFNMRAEEYQPAVET